MMSFAAGIVFGLESGILSYLLNSLWQVPILFAAGWMVARLLRPIGTAAEHRAWVSVLVLQALLPACSALPYGWLRMRLFPGGATGSGEAHVSVVMGAGTAWNALSLPAELLAGIAIVYSVVCSFFVARFAWRWLRLRAIRQQAVEVALTGEAANCWTRCAERFGVDGVSIAASPRIFGPVTMGIARKLVLLPAGMFANLTEAEMQTVIAHEFAHIRRNDFFKNALYELLSLPLSYHPLFWLTRERIMESREMVCDQMAAEIAGRRQYAQSLLRLAALLVQGRPARTAHAIGIFDANLFERRLMKLTAKQTEIGGVRRLAIVAACAVFGIGTCGVVLGLGQHVDAQAAKDSGIHQVAPGVLSVPAGKMQENVLTKKTPVYPDLAKKARVQGTVVLAATIDKDGTVQKLNVLSGPPLLRQSSLDTVRQWTYKPYLLNGNPVEVETKISVIYSLAGKSKGNKMIPPPPPPPPPPGA
jgi:TonB family protein